jgi:hypothetical protein
LEEVKQAAPAMKKILFFLVFVAISVVGCSSQRTIQSVKFPLEKGTTWVYSYEAYEQSVVDSNQIVKAIYQLTETILETETVSPYFIANVKKEYQLIYADSAWVGDIALNQPRESWYILNEYGLFESHQPVDRNNIRTDELAFVYDFPLSMSKSWCSLQLDRKNPNQKEGTGCEFVGKRMVTNAGTYQTPAGEFDACYELTDYYNSGNVIQWFCEGIGIVFMKYDHAGTRFGFEQTLLSYSIGAP